MTEQEEEVKRKVIEEAKDDVFVDSSDDDERIMYAWLLKDFNPRVGSIFVSVGTSIMVASHYKKKDGGRHEFISLITRTKDEKIKGKSPEENFIYLGEVYYA